MKWYKINEAISSHHFFQERENDYAEPKLGRRPTH